MTQVQDVTLLIPMYASERFMPVIQANIDSHIAAGGKVICSDQHGLDDSAARLADQYRDIPTVQILSHSRGGNWVSNINELIAACETAFFRIMPHDDSTDAAATALLAQVLRDRPDVIMCQGILRAQDADGQRMPERDQPVRPTLRFDEPLNFSAGFFWTGDYAGSFKGVIRRNMIDGGPLMIRLTPSLRHSERAWLFALTLLGKFAFCPESEMIKRYYKGSTSSDWQLTSADMLETAQVMAEYSDALLTNKQTIVRLRFNLFLNATALANWIDGLVPARPAFEPPLAADAADTRADQKTTPLA